MTDTKASRFNWLLIPYVGAAVLSLATNLGDLELTLLYVVTAIIVCAHIHFGVNVVSIVN